MRFFFVILFSVLFFSQPVLAKDDVFLRLHGSNTIGAKLGPELVRGWLLQQGASHISTVKYAEEEIGIVFSDAQGQRKVVQIQSHGSSTSFKSLKKGMADIGMASRPIKKKENNRLKNFGDMTRKDSEYVIGLDGIAVIVNKVNPISHLKKSTISKIFTGKITHWSQIQSDLSGTIHVYSRDNKSGTYDTFKALVIGKKSQLIGNAKRYESNDKLSEDVSNDVLAIGFVGLPSVHNSKALAVSEKGTVAKQPLAFDIATEDYALARRLYMYIPDVHANPLSQSFINYVQSSKGQHIVDATGFISQNFRSQSVTPTPGFPKEYLSMTKKAKRLSLNFRFKKGSIKLDNKALRDVDRLVKYLAKSENKGKKVMLFGFVDPSESSPTFSLDLSTYRVDWVSDLLIKHGIDPVRVRAYGSAIPVASNEDAGGRHKNRRVEVWLKV